MMTTIGYGVDLSHWNDVNKVPWDSFPGIVDFVICRAAYGSGLRDRAVVEHMRRARQVVPKVGLYHFFRPSQDWSAQWDLLREVADAVQLTDGDIVPALDIELDPFPVPTPVSPEWEPACREFVEKISEVYGDAMVYITQREFGMLGKPAWVLRQPLWVAHYTAAAAPASPGGIIPTIWQHRVGPFDPKAPGGYDKVHPDFDQDRLILPLPIIGQPEPDLLSNGERARIMGIIAETESEEIQDDTT